MWNKNIFLQNLDVLIMKNNLLLQFVKSFQFKHLVHASNFTLMSSNYLFFQKIFFSRNIAQFGEKTKQKSHLPKLANSIFATNFDLCMSKGPHDIFPLVINFLGAYWQHKQVTIILFRATKTINQTLIKILTKCFINMGEKETSLLMRCLCQK